MTVASLWKVLDRANCGKFVGTSDIAQNTTETAQNSASFVASKRLSLAVDLSIWICESLTSHALSDNHANPALHLVFSRTVRLLSLGVKLVFVIEGKRRIRGEAGQDDKFRKRRSGTAFWKACNDCQQMLNLLGVPVVRAKAEGEALCAFLNQRGVVDGVISNDGDCLLFGAKTVYTKFTLENLENSRVLRYDLDELRAVVEASDDTDVAIEETGTLSLSRQDLIAFALLTGSDLAGNGLHNVGHKKAIRFIRKCQLDYPLSKKTAAIDEMRAWARAAAVEQVEAANNDTRLKTKCCSRCCHQGTKRCHEKHGCEVCGTAPGEPCYQLTSDDKFRKSLRIKALAVQPPFEPSFVFDAYMRPNDNQMPILLANKTSQTLRMSSPCLRELLRLPVVIKGQMLGSSRDYVRNAVARLLSRNELLYSDTEGKLSHPDDPRQALSRERPVPKQITKFLVKDAVPCYQVTWVVKATLTDDEGNGVDGYEYSTIEPRDLIDKRFRNLVETFQAVEKERKKQGDAEQVRRQGFLENLLVGGSGDDNDKVNGNPCAPQQRNKRLEKQKKKRQDFFDKNRAKTSPKYDAKPKKKKISYRQDDNDVPQLIQVVGSGRSPDVQPNSNKPLGMVIYAKEERPRKQEHDGSFPSQARNVKEDESSDQGIYCRMGGFTIEITPIVSTRPVGTSPPRYVVVREY